MRRQINRAGLQLIEDFEGMMLVAYDDANPRKKLTKDTPLSEIKGTLTIGIGHTGPDVYPGQVITEYEARRLLQQDVHEAEHDVITALAGAAYLTDNQFAACVSLAFNIGGPRFATSTVAKRVLMEDYAGAAEAFKLWNKVREYPGGPLVVSAGLVRRRSAEAALFLTPDGSDQPELIADARPTTTPAEVVEGDTTNTVIAKTVATVGGAITAAGAAWKQVESIGLGAVPTYLLLGLFGVACVYLLRKPLRKLVGL